MGAEFWGRLIGFAFLVPLIWLWSTCRIERRMLPWLGLLVLLGAVQGLVGWVMVASGFLPETTAVSPYRLVIHLVLALVLYVAILWTGLTVLHPIRARRPASGNSGHWRLPARCLSHRPSWRAGLLPAHMPASTTTPSR